MSQILCEDLKLGYDGKSILENLSFEVNEGDYLCIIGENGSGKSTLMKVLLNLKSPMEGIIKMGDGVSSTQIGYLPQQTDIQKDFPASIEEIVRSGCLNQCGLRPFYTKEEKNRANEAMKQLGILDMKKRCYRELSGGQQQRVLLARAICATSKLLLLDEPVAGLDPNATIEMYQMIELLNKKGISIIMISHDVNASIQQCSHVLHIGNKSILFYGRKEEYLSKNNGGGKCDGITG
ncbi:MAG: metal ABC transporter ATP-binding protein [Lachnospiraceae bacterium]